MTTSSTLSVAAAFAQIPWLAVAIATVVSAGLGALYFMVLVPAQYTRVLGRQGRPAAATSAGDTITPVLCVLATVITSSLLITALNLQTVGQALVFALVVGLGYQTAMTFNIAHNPNFPHPVLYGLLNAPYFLAVSVITSVLVVGLS